MYWSLTLTWRVRDSNYFFLALFPHIRCIVRGARRREHAHVRNVVFGGEHDGDCVMSVRVWLVRERIFGSCISRWVGRRVFRTPTCVRSGEKRRQVRARWPRGVSTPTPTVVSRRKRAAVLVCDATMATHTTGTHATHRPTPHHPNPVPSYAFLKTNTRYPILLSRFPEPRGAQPCDHPRPPSAATKRSSPLGRMGGAKPSQQARFRRQTRRLGVRARPEPHPSFISAIIRGVSKKQLAALAGTPRRDVRLG